MRRFKYFLLQVYVFLAERTRCVVPIAYALLPNKTTGTYIRMLNLLKSAWPALRPISVVMDFEEAMMNALGTVFPEALVQGCFFHLVKNVKRKVASEGLWQRYTSDDRFSHKARMFAALAYVPPEELNNAVAELSPELPDELVPVLNYFEDFYIGRLTGIRPDGTVTRRPPRFPFEMWSVYQRTLDGEARTNNYAEAAHRKLQLEFGVQHPTLWKFIDGLKRVQKGRDLQLELFVAGNPPARKRNKYVKADERILDVVRNAGGLQHLEYLRGLAHNFFMEA